MDDSSLILRKGAVPKPYKPDVNLHNTNSHLLANESINGNINITQDLQNIANEHNYQQPYVIIDAHPNEVNMEGEVIQDLVVIKNEENCIDIDEMQIEDIEPGNADVSDQNSKFDTSPNLSTKKTTATDCFSIGKRLPKKKTYRPIHQGKLKIPGECTGRIKKKKRKTPSVYTSQIKFKSKASKAISTMQILPRTKEQWGKAEKELALGLFYKSPSTYNFLQNQNLILPNIDTVRNWIGNFDIKPGLNPILLSRIKHKVSTMEDKDKACTLVFARIRIEGNPNYFKDGIPPEYVQPIHLRNTEWNTHALIFVLRGVYSNWSLPLAYFVGEKETDVLSRYLVQSVRKALDTGLTVCGVFGDLDYKSKYPVVLTALGVTPDKPYFLVDNVKILALLNIFSLLEMIKYHWTRNDFLFCGKRVSLHDVSHALKCGFSGVNANFCHVPPIFCKTTSSLIKQAGKKGQLKSRVATDTAEFVRCLGSLHKVLIIKDFEWSGFLFIIDKTLNKIKNGVYKVTLNEPNNSERLHVFRHLETLLRAVIMFCDEYQPKQYPNLVMNFPVCMFIKDLFFIGDSDPTLETFRNQFRESFVKNMMQSTNEDV